MRIDVVLPAPSGPIRPNISPASTANDTSSTARTAPYRLVTRSKANRGRHAAVLAGNSASTGMPGLSTPSRLSTLTLIR